MRNVSVANRTKMDSLASEVDSTAKKASSLLVDIIKETASVSNKGEISAEVKSLLSNFPVELREDIMANAIATFAISYSGVAPSTSNSRTTDVTRGKKKKKSSYDDFYDGFKL